MKKPFLLSLMLLLALAGSAFAFTGVLPVDNTPTTVQNVKGISPQVGAAACTQISKTKGLLATYATTDTAGKYYLQLDWTASDNAGAPLVVKRTLNSNTAYQPGSSGSVTINHGINQVSYSAYSTAAPPKAYNICVDRQ